MFARELTRQWSGAGHDVTVFSQDPHPERFDLGGAATVRPDVGGLLPMFVIDDYEGYRVELVQNLSRAELDDWVEANAAAIREHGPFDLVSPTTWSWAARSRAATGMPLHRDRPRLRARVLDARQRRAVGVGRRDAARRARR